MLNDIDNIFYFLSNEEKEKIKEKYKDTKLNKEEIIKEICETYNLDYNKTVRRNNLDKDITNISILVANFIRSIIKLFRKNVLNRKIESILETIVKLIVFIIIIMIFKIPFIFFDYFANYISNMLFYPFNYSLDYVFRFIVSLIYMLVCITWGIKLFGNYNGIEKKEIDNKKIESVDSDYKYLDNIIRIIIYFVALIPLGILLFINIILFIISIYLVITGVNIVGAPILLIGLIMIIISIIKLFKDGLYNKKDSRIIKLSVSSLIFIFGCILFVYNISQFKQMKDIDSSDMDTITESLQLQLNDINTKIIVKNGSYEIISDNSLEGNTIKIETTYYDDYVDILYSQTKMDDINFLSFKTTPDKAINYGKFFNSVYKDLKRGYLFNYSDVNKIYIKIYANDELKQKIEGKNE